MRKKIVELIKNRKIRNKFFYFSYSLIFISILFFLVASLIMYQIYKKELYQKSTSILNLSTEVVDERLDRVTATSLQILEDGNVQNALIALNGSDLPYEKYQERTQLWNNLSQYINNKPILDIVVVDESSHETLATVNSMYLSTSEVQKIWDKLPTSPSKGQYFKSQVNDVGIYARSIFSSKGLELKKLGTVFIMFDLDFIDEVLTMGQVDDNYLFYLTIDQLSFLKSGGSDEINEKDFLTELKNKNQKDGYSVLKTKNKQSYLLTQRTSRNSEGVYYFAIPIKKLTLNIISVQIIILLFMLICYLIMLIISKRYLNWIISPIENLAVLMDKVKKNDFEYKDILAKNDYRSDDEVGQLYQNFGVMLDHIDWLIRENYQKKILVQEIEFRSLQSQINPHFLYNTLDSINWMAKLKNESEISEMVQALAFLFRSLINNNRPVISLKEEIDFIENYLTIQKVRYGRKLTYFSLISVDSSKVFIPKLIIQPLIENAIHYAAEPMQGNCLIHLTVKKQGDLILIKVSDNGPGFNDNERDFKSKGSGIGLKNVDQRIKLYYGEAYGIDVVSIPNIKTEVCLTIPFEEGDKDV